MHARFKEKIRSRIQAHRAGTQSPWRHPRDSMTHTFFRRLFLTLGVVSFVLLIIGGLSALAAWRSNYKPLPGKFVIAIKLDGDYPEYNPVENPIGDTPTTFIDVIDSIDRAAGDERVRGIVVDMEGNPESVAHIQEMRDAILRFRKSGKFADIYAPDYGEPGRGLGSYYFASAFDKIWMQPVGVLSIGGVSAEMPYARDLLDKYDVKPEFFQRKEYKSLFETFTNDHMSAPAREEMTALVNDIAGQFMTGIEQQKKLDPAALKKIVDGGLYTDSDALRIDLVDRLDGYEALKNEVADEISGSPDTDHKSLKKLATAKKSGEKTIENGKLFVDIDRYVVDTRHALSHSAKKNVAVIYIAGAIESASQSTRAPPSGNMVGFGDQFSAAVDPTDAIYTAADDSSIPIIVLRINSPGGSPGASETIRRAVLYAQKKGKKIVISMGDECASGGYWIASAGDYIFAEPGTLTGSIGVAGGKVDLSGVWHRFGVNWEGVSFGETADMWSFNHPFTPQESARVDVMLDSVYAAFVERVAEGRHMSVPDADKIARGRVWTGQQAKDRHLVDALGGLDAALDYAARQVGLKDRTQLTRETYPKPQSPFEKLENLADQSAAPNSLRTLAPILQSLQQTLDAAQYETYLPLRVR